MRPICCLKRQCVRYSCCTWRSRRVIPPVSIIKVVFLSSNVSKNNSMCHSQYPSCVLTDMQLLVLVEPSSASFALISPRQWRSWLSTSPRGRWMNVANDARPAAARASAVLCMDSSAADAAVLRLCAVPAACLAILYYQFTDEPSAGPSHRTPRGICASFVACVPACSVRRMAATVHMCCPAVSWPVSNGRANAARFARDIGRLDAAARWSWDFNFNIGCTTPARSPKPGVGAVVLPCFKANSLAYAYPQGVISLSRGGRVKKL